MDSESPTPTVSIVIPAYNRAATIRRAVESALKQTHTDIEIVVVDDASTDGTSELLSSIPDPRLKCLRQDCNRGVSNARNAGVAVAKGDWIAFLDSDDEWLPAKIHGQLAHALHSDNADRTLFYHPFTRLQHGQSICLPLSPYSNTDSMSDYLFLQSGSIHPSTLLLKRTLFMDFEFDPLLPIHEDWDLLLRMRAAGVIFSFQPEAWTIRHVLPDDQRLGGNTLLEVSCQFLRDRQSYFSKKSSWAFQGRIISQKLFAKRYYTRALWLCFQSWLHGGLRLRDILQKLHRMTL